MCQSENCKISVFLLQSKTHVQLLENLHQLSNRLSSLVSGMSKSIEKERIETERQRRESMTPSPTSTSVKEVKIDLIAPTPSHTYVPSKLRCMDTPSAIDIPRMTIPTTTEKNLRKSKIEASVRRRANRAVISQKKESASPLIPEVEASCYSSESRRAARRLTFNNTSFSSHPSSARSMVNSSISNDSDFSPLVEPSPKVISSRRGGILTAQTPIHLSTTGFKTKREIARTPLASHSKISLPVKSAMKENIPGSSKRFPMSISKVRFNLSSDDSPLVPLTAASSRAKGRLVNAMLERCDNI
jgi:hypothetical protein